MKKDKIVKIQWEDTSSNSGWRDRKFLKEWARKNTMCESVGFLVAKNKRNVILAAMKDMDKRFTDYNDYHKIPRRCIKNIKILK